MMIYIVEISREYEGYTTISVHTSLLGENGAMAAANAVDLEKLWADGVHIKSGKIGQPYDEFETVELFDETVYA